MRKKHTRFRIRKRVIIGALLGIAVAAAAVVAGMLYQEQSKQSALIDPAMLARYETRDASGIDRSRLAPDVMPPTNTWYSAIALAPSPEPVLAYPNSYQVQPSGLKMGLPTVEVSANAVEAAHRLGASIEIQGAVNYKIVRHDQISVDVAYYDEQQREIAIATLAAGVPVVPILARQPVTVAMDVERALILHNQAVGGENDQWFGLQQVDGRPKLENERVVSKIKEGQFASIYTAPSRESLDAIAPYVLNRPMNTTVEYRTSPRRITTEISVRTANNQPTVMALLPHQQSEEYATIAEYPSQFGPLPLVALRTLTTTTAPVSPGARLSLSGVSDEQKSALIAQLHRDIAATRLDASDPLEGGQQLQRAAQLLLLASELNQDTSITLLTNKLNRAFDDWLSPQSARGFYFDTGIKGMVAKQAAADVKMFDRHHTIYGYFLYAASVLADVDKKFAERHASAVNLLAADIASYKELDAMPVRRYYDPYRGHSWDIGVATTPYGNQQASSAEAINAWNGLALWARATQNTSLEEQALWLLANEAASAKRYISNISIPGYEHTSFGTRWGSKREWSTRLPEAPNAPVGLQLTPMTPALATIYRTENDLLARLLAQPELVLGARFSDGLMMAHAIAHDEEGEVSAPVDSAILEPSMSKAYLMAFLASEAAQAKR